MKKNELQRLCALLKPGPFGLYVERTATNTYVSDGCIIVRLSRPFPENWMIEEVCGLKEGTRFKNYPFLREAWEKDTAGSYLPAEILPFLYPRRDGRKTRLVQYLRTEIGTIISIPHDCIEAILSGDMAIIVQACTPDMPVLVAAGTTMAALISPCRLTDAEIADAETLVDAMHATA